MLAPISQICSYSSKGSLRRIAPAAALKLSKEHTNNYQNQLNKACVHLILENVSDAGQEVDIAQDGPTAVLSQILALHKNHIFISPYIWNKFCHYYRIELQTNHYFQIIHINEWNMYQTPSGLLYLTRDNALPKNYFNTTGWKKIAMQLAPVSLRPFDLDMFKAMFVPDKKTSWFFYVDGHGSPTFQLPNGELIDKYSGKFIRDPQNIYQAIKHETLIAGTESQMFKKILSFIGHDLNTKQIIVNSCYTYPGRIFALLEKKTLPYDLITGTTGHEIVTSSSIYEWDSNGEIKILSEPLIPALGIEDKNALKKLLFTTAICQKPSFVAANTNVMEFKK